MNRLIFRVHIGIGTAVWRYPTPSPHDAGVGRGLGRGAALMMGCLFHKPLSPTLSPLVPHGEREINARPVAVSSARPVAAARAGPGAASTCARIFRTSQFMPAINRWIVLTDFFSTPCI
jgi:hypothetical protein